MIVQVNNTIYRIFILSLPFFTFFYFSFHIFFGNLSLINNHINNICDLRNLPYNKLVHGDKNDNVIISLKHISKETLKNRKKKKKNVKMLFPLTFKKKKKKSTQLPHLVILKMIVH